VRREPAPNSGRIGISPDQVRREHHDVVQIEVFG
jgi:hypothetical protein